MTTFECIYCSEEFARNYDMLRHIRTSCPKAPKTKQKKQYECPNPGCEYTTPRPDNLDRHLDTCSHQINNTVTNTDVMTTNNGSNNKQNIDGDHNNQNNASNNKICNNNINLIVFTRDGINDMLASDLFNVISSKKSPIERIIEVVNFNPNKPEHHNIYWSDKKSGFGKVYEDDGWNDIRVTDMINRLLSAKLIDLNSILEMYGDMLSETAKAKIKKSIEDIRGGSIGQNTRKLISEYVRAIIYNNRKMVKKTRKKMKKNKSFEKHHSKQEISLNSDIESDDDIYDLTTIDLESVNNTDAEYDESI
jgi:hypothetical protein